MAKSTGGGGAGGGGGGRSRLTAAEQKQADSLTRKISRLDARMRDNTRAAIKNGPSKASSDEYNKLRKQKEKAERDLDMINYKSALR